MTRYMRFCSLTAAMALAVGCSGSPETPLSPTAATSATGLAANPDGSTLKMTAPTPLSPGGGETLGSRRPSFSFRNSTSATGVAGISGVAYRVQLLNEDGSLAGERLVTQTSGDTSIIEADVELDYEKNFVWRVRAELDAAFGPWSATESFRSPDRPRAGGTPTSGAVGPQRTISLQEALGIIRRVHDELRWDLGGRSSRDQRVEFLFSAVGAIHYGHARFNPTGPDPLWCVKDAGGGRPPSDDVLVRCDSRDAWDLIGGAGGNGYSFHLDYLGRLPNNQNVYPPPASFLGALGR